MSHERSIPVVTAIIERTFEGEKQIIIQKRWKPQDQYHNRWEMPAGKIEQYEHIRDALIREIHEETGLHITKITPDVFDKGEGEACLFNAYCCHQQLHGGMPWIGFAFVCEVSDTEPCKEGDGTREIQWKPLRDVEEIITENPESFFALQIPLLNYYITQQKKLSSI